MAKTEQPQKQAKAAPIEKFRSGGLQVDVWQNKGEKGDFQTVSFQRSYKDKDGDWQTTQSLRVNDLPVLNMLLGKAFEYCKMKKAAAEEAE